MMFLILASLVASFALRRRRLGEREWEMSGPISIPVLKRVSSVVSIGYVDRELFPSIPFPPIP
jgi:hypothetical protein